MAIFFLGEGDQDNRIKQGTSMNQGTSINQQIWFPVTDTLIHESLMKYRSWIV